MIIVYAAVLLGILIFLFAKLMGVKVLKFSLGFGPKIIGRKFGDTEYLIAAVPLGGYVKMLGEEPGEELDETEKAKAYNYQAVWKRFLIVFSGPFLALIFAMIFLSGVPVPLPDIGNVQENSPAATAGLSAGDRVVQIDDTKIEDWNDISAILNENRGQPLLFRVTRDGRTVEAPVQPQKKTVRNIFTEEDEVWHVGIEPLIHPVVGGIVKGSRAEQAGLQPGDRIAEIGDRRLETWQDMTALIHKSPEKPLLMKIKRGEELLELTITPRKETIATPEGDEEVGLIGIKPANQSLKNSDLSNQSALV